jgi:uncharacterized membrane protein YGL010W
MVLNWFSRVGAVVGLVVLAPLIVTAGLSLFSGGAISTSNLAIGIVVSAAISLAISIVFYRINLGIAADFLKKAQI